MGLVCSWCVNWWKDYRHCLNIKADLNNIINDGIWGVVDVSIEGHACIYVSIMGCASSGHLNNNGLCR